jgi:tRNA threonylcarbamoyladenosine biosynthesis protein TsaE
MKTWTFASPDAEQTFECGAELGRSIGSNGLAIALTGPLGAGKTVFVKGLAKGLGVDPRVVSSPTFVIAQQYVLPLGHSGPETLHHVDLYRLESSMELESIGFHDMLAVGQVAAVEWADRFPGVLGREYLLIEFEGPSPEEEDAAREGTPWRGRSMRVTACGEDPERVLEDWAGRVDHACPSSGGRVVSTPEMRVLSILLLVLSLFLIGRFDRNMEEPICEVLVPVGSDELGTLRARCEPATAEEAEEAEERIALTGIARLLDGGRVDLNHASALLLQNLPGIGPVRAEAIVSTRSELAFSSVEDLERVPGIGPKTRMRIQPWVFVAQNEGRTDSLLRRSRGDG